jgi:hypothetical protein
VHRLNYPRRGPRRAAWAGRTLLRRYAAGPAAAALTGGLPFRVRLTGERERRTPGRSARVPW